MSEIIERESPSWHLPAMIVLGLIAIGGLLAGNAWLRAKVGDLRKPGWVTGGPVHGFVALHRKALQWAVLALGLVILVIWSDPTALVAVIVVAVTLVVVGLLGVFAGAGPRPAVAGPSSAAGEIEGGGRAGG